MCEVVDALGIPQPTVSKAFKTLREAGLVADRRDANWIYFRLNETVPAWIADVIETTVTDLAGRRSYADDERRFERSRIRETTVC